jgi:hypothetical protein
VAAPDDVRGERAQVLDDELDAAIDRPARRHRPLGGGAGGAQSEVDEVVVLGVVEP